MSDLVEFLKGRLGLVEAAANALLADEEAMQEWNNPSSEAVARLHGLFDPKATLREVESKRELLDLHTPQSVNFDEWACVSCAPAGLQHETRDEAACRTLRLLAELYADHPDYDESWRA